MKFIPSVLSILLLADTAIMTNGVSATSNNIFDDTSNSDVSNKTEVAVLSTVDDAVISNDVFYDFKKFENFVVSVPTSELEYLPNDPNILVSKRTTLAFSFPTPRRTTAPPMSAIAPFEDCKILRQCLMTLTLKTLKQYGWVLGSPSSYSGSDSFINLPWSYVISSEQRPVRLGPLVQAKSYRLQ